MNKQSVCEIVRQAETNYKRGSVRIGTYVSFSMSKTIDTIDAYLNSKHTSGETDSLGREKPFFNIVTSVANIWYRATDIDRKDIRFIASKSKDVALTFVANVLLQDWMIREKFGVFLNLWGRALSRYGSSVVKFVEQDGRLIPSVTPWSRFIPDAIAFDAIPSIEKFYYTPAQLRENPNYDQKMVEALIESVADTRKDIDGESRDLNANFIEVYEVHGKLPMALLKSPDKIQDSDWTTFRQQMHTISFVGSNREGEDYKDFTLFRGKEKKPVHMITHLIEEEGRTLSIGGVELLFDAQWMQNHTVKQQKDYLDIASKIILQTSDRRFQGRNVLNAIENGDILTHEDNKPLTQLNNNANNMNALIQFGNQWLVLGKEISSTPDAVRGNTMPSGTPYSLVSILQQQAGSLFEIMTENKGLALEEMLREYIIPFLKKKMDTSDEIGAILDDYNIKQLDAMYVPREATRRYVNNAIDELIQGNVPSPYQQQFAEGQVQQELSQLGNQRFFKPSEISTETWNKVLKDFEWKVTVEVTNEAFDKKAALETLTSVFTTIGQNEGAQSENARTVLSEILKISGGISPLQLSPSRPTPPPMQPPQGADKLQTANQ